MPSYNNVIINFVYIILNVCVQLLISRGGQLLGNDDGVKIPLGSGLPVTSHFTVLCFTIIIWE